jgi:predicted metalloenzyme YecM
MEVNYNMLVQNHVYYNMLSKTITLWGGGVMVKDLTPQCEGEEFKSPHLQPRLRWLFR